MGNFNPHRDRSLRVLKRFSEMCDRGKLVYENVSQAIDGLSQAMNAAQDSSLAICETLPQALNALKLLKGPDVGRIDGVHSREMVEGEHASMRVEVKISGGEFGDEPWFVLEEMLDPGLESYQAMQMHRESGLYSVIRVVNESTGFTRDVWNREW